LFLGPEPLQVARTRDELLAMGATEIFEDRADAALVRAAAGSGAEFVVMPVEELSLTDGVGGLLRYRTRVQ
jgi:hypothetical protein